MGKMKWLGLAVCLSALGLGCAQDEKKATAVALVIKSDLQLNQELANVWVRVFPADADVKTARPLLDLPLQPATTLDRPIVLTKSGREEFLVAVQGLGPGGKEAPPLVEQRLRARFVDGQTMVVPVFLARSCMNKGCDETPGQTCYGERRDATCDGSCGPIVQAQPIGSVDDEDDPLITGSYMPQKCGCPDGGTCDGSPTPPPPDCGDGGVVGDGGMCQPACTPSMPGGSCNVVEQCGCGAGTSCGAKLSADNKSLTLECIVPGAKREGMACSYGECGPGLVCIGPAGKAVCRAFCDTSTECGPGGACKPINIEAGRPAGYSACFEACRTNSDCASTGCCLGGSCAPADECPDTTDPTPPTMCRSNGQACTSSAQCCASVPYCIAQANGTRTCTAASAVPASLCGSATAGSSECSICFLSDCCAPITACRNATACQQLITCMDACTTPACRTTCGQNNAAGLALYNAGVSCQNTNCAAECQ